MHILYEREHLLLLNERVAITKIRHVWGVSMCSIFLMYSLHNKLILFYSNLDLFGQWTTWFVFSKAIQWINCLNAVDGDASGWGKSNLSSCDTCCWIEIQSRIFRKTGWLHIAWHSIFVFNIQSNTYINRLPIKFKYAHFYIYKVWKQMTNEYDFGHRESVCTTERIVHWPNIILTMCQLSQPFTLANDHSRILYVYILYNMCAHVWNIHKSHWLRKSCRY